MFNRNTFRIFFGILIVTLLASLAVLALRQTVMPRDSMLKAQVSPRIIQLGDSIQFNDSTPFAQTYKWVFGDGNWDSVQAGAHRFSQPGNYTVILTVNNQFRDSFFVRVQGQNYEYTKDDSVFKIQGQSAGFQGEEVMFRVDGYGSDQFTWNFGDGSKEETTTLSAIKHIYRSPGVYVVSLYSRNNREPANHKIVISPEFDATDTSGLAALMGGGAQADAGNEFQIRLQRIIDGGDFTSNYNYLLKYACQNAKVTVKVNNSGTRELYNYCQYLRGNRNIVIKSVQLIYNGSNKCVTGVNIEQDEK